MDPIEPDIIDELSEIELPWYHTRFLGRLLSAVLPPLGFVLLWTHPNRRRSRKLIGTLLLAIYSVGWVVAIGALGIRLEWFALDWDGGEVPRLVRRRDGPNYTLLEQDRALQTARNRASNVATNGLDVLTAGPPPYWTDFRGPRRDGHYDERSILTRWPSRGLRQLWHQPCGGGYASFVVAYGRAFTLEQRRDEEVVVAYDLESGLELWRHAYEARFHEWMGGDGPRATPTYSRERLYSLGATGKLCCLGARTGTLVWERNVLEDTGSENLRYGLATSPLVVNEQLIVLAGGASEQGSLAAYDALTGELLWTALPEQMAYASPVWLGLAGREQLVLVTATGVLGFDPATQETLWRLPWEVSHGNATCPAVPVGEGRFFLGAGYGTRGTVIEVSREGDQWQARKVWESRALRTKFNPAVYHESHLYGLDEGVLACVDAATGERLWRAGRFGYGQLLLASGHLLVLGGHGRVALVKATPDGYQPVASFQALSGKTWNVPALAQGRLLVRNSAEMACYQISSNLED